MPMVPDESGYENLTQLMAANQPEVAAAPAQSFSLSDLQAPVAAPQSSLPGLNILTSWSNQIRQDQVAKARSEVVQQALKQYHSGDLKGAFATIGSVMPEAAGKSLVAQTQAGPIAEAITRGQQTALTEVGANAGQKLQAEKDKAIAEAERRGEQKGQDRKDKLSDKNDSWATQAWGKITVGQPFKDLQQFKVRENTLKRAASDPSAFGDIGAVFAFMKTLDPQSVVRESEYATAAQAGSLLTRAKNAVTKAEKGEMLTPGQREDLIKMTDHLGSIYQTNYKDFIKPLENQAKKRGVDMAEINPYHVAKTEVPAEYKDAAAFADANPNDPRSQTIKDFLKSKGF